MEVLLTAAQRGEPGSHAVLRVMYIFLYIHTCVTYVFLMFFHLWSVPGGWLWLSPQRPLLLIHPKCKSLHLPTASSWASHPPSPSAILSLICVDFRLVLMLRLKPVTGNLHLRKATLLVLSPGVKSP